MVEGEWNEMAAKELRCGGGGVGGVHRGVPPELSERDGVMRTRVRKCGASRGFCITFT